MMKIPATVKKITKIFKEHQFEIYLVGGALRDQLLKEKNLDFDFTTDARPEEVMQLFSHVIPVGVEHGTVLVLFEDQQFEITTFRTEGKYSDHRRPDSVEFVRSLEEDLKRRDFTINAFAYDLIHNKFMDLFEGKKDLKNKLIRAIGKPEERFAEDALRMMRACRFAARLEFVIEEKTLAAMEQNAHLIKEISAERIRDELIKLMKAPRPSVGIEYMRVTGLLEHIMPELLEGYLVDQNRFHQFDVYHHNLYSCDGGPADNHIVRFAALLHDVAKPHTRQLNDDKEGHSFYNHEIIGARVAKKILRRLKFSNEEIAKITHLIKHHMFYYTDEWTDGAIRRFLRNVGIENLPDLFQLRDADRFGNGKKIGIPQVFLDFRKRIEEILEIDNALKVTDLKINGHILMTALELKPSPLIGEILNYLLENVLDHPEYNEEEKLLELAKEYYEKKTQYAQEEYGDKPENLGQF
ncbi:MAG: CCA tRNA nucleotidyltransferase [Spirochaetes bacterium]|nr:CCA tRNA nucleotidyltransferase [Spirochaetota bacterium]